MASRACSTSASRRHRIGFSRRAPDRSRASSLTCPRSSSGRSLRLALIDVYAAGVVLWETLTRKRLFSAEDEGRSSASSWRTSSLRRARSRPHVPPELDAIVPEAPLEGARRSISHRPRRRTSDRGRGAPRARERGGRVGRGGRAERPSRSGELREGARELHGQRIPAAYPRGDPTVPRRARAHAHHRTGDRSNEAHARVAFGQTGMPVTHAITPVSMGGVLPPRPRSRERARRRAGRRRARRGPRQRCRDLRARGQASCTAGLSRRARPRPRTRSRPSPEPERSWRAVPETSLEPPPSAVPPPVSPVSPSSPYRPSLRSAKPRAVAAPRPAAPPAPGVER